MAPTLIRIPITSLLLGSLMATLGCNKPTTGQNNLEYREGQSGATSKTLKEDTSLDSTEEKREQEKK